MSNDDEIWCDVRGAVIPTDTCSYNCGAPERAVVCWMAKNDMPPSRNPKRLRHADHPVHRRERRNTEAKLRRAERRQRDG